MISATLAPSRDAVDSERHLIGRHSGSPDGPIVVCFGGLHGNEPLGVTALKRVLEGLAAADPGFRGDFLGVQGNLRALSLGNRYVQSDLNRIWTEDRVGRIRAVADFIPASSEDLEQSELLRIIDQVFEPPRRRTIFLDLHTTSADSGPFSIIGDTLRNRAFARRLPVPIILGLEEQIDGALMEYVNSLGAITYGFEAGRHQAPESADRHEALVWLALAAAGCISESDIPDLQRRRQILIDASRGQPPVVEVRHRQPVTPGDGFVMRPGYVNFQPIRKGEVLAHDRRGKIRAKESGRILMPLYQSLGSDGFFIVREVKPFWLDVSRHLRRLKLDVLLPWLPGVRRDPKQPEVLHVNPRVARFFPVEIFHLLGYRKLRASANELVVTRRAYDFPE